MPHLQRGKSFGLKIGSLSFLFIAIFVAQFGRRCKVLLLHIPTRGYDVCGDRMLGIRWRSSFEFVVASIFVT
jgi:hypothetical protein